MHLIPRSVLAAVLSALALAPAAVPAGTARAAAPDPAGTARAAAPAGIDWRSCAPDGLECGTVTVPVDWSDRDGPTIDLAVARRRATGPGAAGESVLFLPGGPGSSGVAVLRQRPAMFAPEVHRRFDVVSIDPRGVGASSPVRCDPQVYARPYPQIPGSPAELAARVAYNRAFGASCRQATGALFGHLDSRSVARDLDAVRAALGQSTLSFYGVSYGTLVGLQYAEMYPRRVRSMVLDSVMDHSLGTRALLRTSARAAEDAVEEFAAGCDRRPSCALRGQDARAVLRAVLGRAEHGELTDPGSGTRLTPLLLLGQVFSLLYGPSWDQLATMLVALRDAPVAPDPGPPATAAPPDPTPALFCPDWRLPVRGFADLDALRRELRRLAPTLGMSPLTWHRTLGCLDWPAPVRNPQHRPRIDRDVPILMVNSRHDPATPHAWAAHAARQTGATLLTYEGWGHSVLWKGSPCVRDHTTAYLLTGRAPATRISCPALAP